MRCAFPGMVFARFIDFFFNYLKEKFSADGPPDEVPEDALSQSRSRLEFLELEMAISMLMLLSLAMKKLSVRK